MCFGIGFLFAILIALALIPLIHARAVRLTMRRMESALPQSTAEIQADKDALRAEFALNVRRLEMSIGELKERDAGQRAEIGRKNDVINRLKIERDAQNIEQLMLKAEVGALRAQCATFDGRSGPSRKHNYEVESAPIAPAGEPHSEAAAAATLAPFDPAPARGDHAARPDVRSDLKAISTRAAAASRPDEKGEASPGESAPNVLPAESHRARTPAIKSVLLDSMRSIASEADDALPEGDASIHVTPGDHLVPGKLPLTGRLMSLSFMTVCIAAGIVIFTWEPGPEHVEKLLAKWIGPAAPVAPVPAKSAAAQPVTVQHDAPAEAETAPQPAAAQQPTVQATAQPAPPQRAAPAQQPGAKADSPALAQQVDKLTNEDADIDKNVQKLAETKEQTPPRPAAETKEARLTPAPQREARQTLFPETPPTTIPGWLVREVSGGVAVVQGPTGTWRVMRGDNLPGLGRVQTIVHWGNRWIVATHAGLISTR